MPSDNLKRLEDRLRQSGIEEKLQAIPEREQLLALRDQMKECSDTKERGKLFKRIKDAEREYALVFQDYVADQYPYLLFERSEDKVWWLYNAGEGIYDELRAGEARSIVLSLLRKEGLRDFCTETHVRNILARYRADYPRRGKLFEEFDSKDDWFHANNGWVHLKTRTFASHGPDRLSRRKSACDYDEKATCPTYDRFLDEDVRLQKDEIRVLDQFSGLLLTHDVRHQKMLTIIGKPGSGKSTLLDTWSHLLGDLVTQNALTDFSGDKYRFMGSSLAGRTLCWFDEVEVKRAEMSSVLERKITAQKIEIERKGIDGTRYAPNYLKFVLTANTLPLSAEQGIYRRLLIIQFNRSFTDEDNADRTLYDKLIDEAPGILNRMLKGLDDLTKMGTFTSIEGHEEKIEEYKASSNTVAEFLDTYFDPVFDGSEEVVETKKLYEAYMAFMKGRTGFQLTPQRFGQMLASQPLSRFSHIERSRLGGRSTGGNRTRGWKGLTLQSDCEWRENERDGSWYIYRESDEKQFDIESDLPEF